MKKTIFILNSFLILICLISLFGGLVYFFYALNNLGIIISSILAVISFIIIQYFRLLANKNTSRAKLEKPEKTRFTLINFLPASPAGGLLTSYFLLLFFCFYILFKSQTTAAIVSPWQAVPKYFFLIYALATLSLIGNLLLNKTIALWLLMLHYFLSFSVALIVYRLGYGYDPFIHRATENLIDKIGAVEPKTFYYSGQYALVVMLHKITALPIALLDKMLVPFLAAIFIPPALWRALKSWFDSDQLNLFLILACLGLTYPFLIVTTPQNLAYILLILAILLGLICKNYYDLLIIFLLALTAAIIQPIAGLPALIFAFYLLAYYSDRKNLKKYYYLFLALATVFILPALFYLLNKNLLPAAGATPSGQSVAAFNYDLIPGRENFILNSIYLLGFNYKIILALLIMAGLFIAYKFKDQCRILFIYLSISVLLFISYWLTLKLPFAFLIDYERNNYAARILLIAALFLLPLAIVTFYALIEKIFKQNIIIKSSFAALLIIIITASLYLSYPRFDNYFNSRGYSVSSADISAVDWINQDAKNNFIVLANQQVSAAALSQFGFKKYYGRDQLFYYPIPTGSPLYQFYLDMVYKKPSRETMNAAMALAGVSQGYFVLNKYWFDFFKILNEAKFRASSWQEIDNGQVYVFKYEK